MVEDSKRCARCVELGRSCDGTLVASTLSRLSSAHRKLENDEQEAEEALFVLQTQLAAALSRLNRVRRMKRVVKEKRSEAFRRGMKELDDEAAAAPPSPPSDPFLEEVLQAPVESFDWSSAGLDPAALPEGFFSDPGAAGPSGSLGGTSAASAGNSVSAPG